MDVSRNWRRRWRWRWWEWQLTDKMCGCCKVKEWCERGRDIHFKPSGPSSVVHRLLSIVHGVPDWLSVHRGHINCCCLLGELVSSKWRRTMTADAVLERGRPATSDPSALGRARRCRHVMVPTVDLCGRTIYDTPKRNRTGIMTRLLSGNRWLSLQTPRITAVCHSTTTFQSTSSSSSFVQCWPRLGVSTFCVNWLIDFRFKLSERTSNTKLETIHNKVDLE